MFDDVDGVSNLTVPEEARKFIDETGVDCLAVAIGTAHGRYKGTPHIDFERLAKIVECCPDTPLVLHGGSGTGDDNLQKAVHSGIQKVNLATELVTSGKEALEEFFKNPSFDKWELIAGVRVEHTDQGYVLKFPRDVDPEGRQKYTDVLPSFHAKYNVHKNANLRLSYARAINRPSFFEIVPYSIINEDYKEKGNPDLKHTVADNFDLRYEFFPKSSEQFMVGLFYKNIQDPIEYGLINEGQDTYYQPMNFGDAKNLGVEVDIMKYFNWFGIKANYTYTHSKVTTDKRIMEGSEVKTMKQTRSLFGQAAHVANLSLLFKDTNHGWEGQLAGSYTGKRLSDISNWYDDDIWEAGYFQLDASVEKSFDCGVSIFAKASNLLDVPLLRYIQKGPRTENITEYERHNGNVVERKEWHGQAILLGVRYKL